MTENKASYKDIIKSNAVFGGIKIFQLLITFIKGKIVAVLLGPSGVGIQTLLITTINTIHQFSNVGFPQSSVRELSIDKDLFKRNKTVKVVNILSIIIGLLGSIFCFVFSDQLAQWVFGDTSCGWMFLVISLSLLLESITVGQISILQGLRKVRILAQASLIGSLLSLIFTVPLYYFWRTNAIPYAITFGYLLSTIILYLMARKASNNVNLSKLDFITRTKSILNLGLSLMVGNCIMSALSMALVLFINRVGNSSEVGYYQAATNCTYMAINIIISVLASDYYPRLSEVSGDNVKMQRILSTQAELMILMLVPLVGFMVAFPSAIIQLLYSSEFINVRGAVQIIALALFFRVLWHSFSYVILAKGDKKAYLIFDALLGNGIFFIGNMIGFYFDKIDGIAISYIIGSILVSVILYLLIKNKYNVCLLKGVASIFAVALLFSVLLYAFEVYTANSRMKNIVEVVYLMVVSFLSLYMIDKRSGLVRSMLNKLKR